MGDATISPSIGGHELSGGLAPSPELAAQPVTLVNVFRPKPGKLDLFLDVQLNETRKMSASAYGSGWRGNRIHRSNSDQLIIIVTEFETPAEKATFAGSKVFQDHLARIAPLLEDVTSYECTLVQAHGTFAANGSDPARRSGNGPTKKA